MAENDSSTKGDPQDEDDSQNYPTGVALAAIIFAVDLAVFLVALVCLVFSFKLRYQDRNTD